MINNLLKKLKINLNQSWYKQNFIVLLVGLFLFSSLSIGYSILSQNLDISGEVVLRAEKDIRVTGITSTITSCGFDIYNPKFNENSITVNLNLPSLDCTIEYSVTVKNNGTKAMELISIINENYNNDKIIYDIIGYNIGDVLGSNESISFKILFKYDSSVLQLPNNTDLGAIIKFVWQIYDDNNDEDIIEPEIFVFKNKCEEYIIPKTGLYVLEVWGAQGGPVTTSTSNSKGGYSKGTAVLTAGETVYVCVGGKGESNETSSYINKGGFNGGGDSKNSSGTSNVRTGGGGATDIRIGDNTLYNRIIVAGGGGGNSSHSNNMIAGNGGGQTGSDGGFGKGGTQTAGGNGQLQEAIIAGFGIGGSQTGNTVGGGGGGWYGGGNGNGAGGGSGYVLTSTSYKPVGYFSQYVNYYLYDTLNVQYGNSGYISNPDSTGNGYAIISHINISLKLIGEAEITVNVGDTYIDQGAILKIDGINQSSNIVKTGTVDTSTVGTYTITYKYTEPLTGKIYIVTRKVIVEESKDYAVDFVYTGSVQTIVAPYTGEYKLEVWGAQGGNNTTTNTGGKGGYSKGTVYLQKGEILYIYVGGNGGSTTNSLSPGGFNGGGTGGNYSSTYYTGGGGGASDIRIGTDSLYSRVIVAGGGGGSGSNNGTTTTANKGGPGGGEIGRDGQSSVSYAGRGGTQTAGGATGTDRGDQNGSFGLGGNLTKAQTGGGGGGGWYGGGSGSWEGGGGGSGFIWTKNTGNTPNGYLLSTSYYLKDAETIAGDSNIPTYNGIGTMTGNSGNGYAKITFINSSSTPDPEPPVVTTNYDFAYTGNVQTFVVPTTGKYKLEVWGAQGGNGIGATYGAAYGGKGGYSTGEIQLIGGTTLYIITGGQGKSGSAGSANGFGGAGGFGGTAWMSANAEGGSGGGGLSGIFTSAVYPTSMIIIAGGGGGAGGSSSSTGEYHLGGSDGGYGGGNTGGNGFSIPTSGASTTKYYGFGGSQSAGGATNTTFGSSYSGTAGGLLYGGGGHGYTPGLIGNSTTLSGGSSITTTNSSSSAGGSGGGGGGYYGGGGGGKFGAGGGGGSSYLGMSLTNSLTIPGNELMPKYYESGTEIGNSGNGFVRITHIQ